MAVLEITAGTLKAGNVNVDEIEKLNSTGTLDVPLLDFSVTTEKGFTYDTEPLENLTAAAAVVRLVGDRAEPVPADGLPALTDYCDD